MKFSTGSLKYFAFLRLIAQLVQHKMNLLRFEIDRWICIGQINTKIKEKYQRKRSANDKIIIMSDNEEFYDCPLLSFYLSSYSSLFFLRYKFFARHWSIVFFRLSRSPYDIEQSESAASTSQTTVQCDCVYQ